MKPYTWLLFDLDNTLFDFNLAEVKALANSFAEFGFPYDEATGDTYRAINKRIWTQLELGEITSSELRTTRFTRLFEAVGIEADPEPFSTAYLRHLGSCSDLIEGAEAIVPQISQQYHIALITNGLSDVQRPRLTASPLLPYFEALIISDEVGIAKPDPGIFDLLFEQMNHPAKEEVLIIGDSVSSDMQGGANYGIATCWFNPSGKPRPASPRIDFEIGQLTDLLGIL